MKQLNARILENKRVAKDFYRLRIEAPYLAKKSAPGQFVEIRCSSGIDPLLRRPFSVHRIVYDGIELLYEVVGRGTEFLAHKKRGEGLDIIGPLGNGFDIVNSSGPAIIVAGGVGVAPLVALAEKIVHSPRPMAHGKQRKIYALIGARTKGHILCEKDFRKLGAEVLVSTEDGSKGKKALATNLLKDLLLNTQYSIPDTIIYACGPYGMLKAVAEITRAKKIQCQMSFEERMACGVGVCLGCPIKVRKGPADCEYKMVCKDGPVFKAKEILW